MKMQQTTLTIQTTGRGSINLTRDINSIIATSKIKRGLCHIFVQHTSASLMLCENADPMVRQDLEAFMQKITPDGDAIYQHTQEGVDDMPAHVRSILTGMDLTIPIQNGQAGLGVWQGVFLWEHRIQSHQRHIVITLQGE